MADLSLPAHLQFRRTKIVATLGPSSDSAPKVKELIEAGVNVFRLNMSHGDHSSHQRAFETVRAVADELGEPVAVLVDLCGPKIRTGSFAGGAITLVEDREVQITTREVEGSEGVIPCQYASLAKDVEAGNRILLDDGNLELCVEATDGEEIRARVVVGGRVKGSQGDESSGSFGFRAIAYREGPSGCDLRARPGDRFSRAVICAFGRRFEPPACDRGRS